MTRSVIGALRVNLGLDSAAFESGARRMSAPLRAMRAQFLGLSAVATATGAALAGVTRAAANTANEIRRLSQVSDTAPEQFQMWAAATRTVGIEQDKLGDILKDTKDRVGDFLTTGGGPMADFFEKIAPQIGVTAEQFRNLSGADALQLYVSSLEKANLSQAEMTFFMEAMASDSTLLLPLLREQGAEMARLSERARELGGVMDNETVESLRTMKLAMADVGTSMAGIGYRIAKEVAPAMQTLARSFADAMREGEPLRRAIDAVITNIDRVTAITLTAVAVLGVRFVGALVAARLAALTLASATAVLTAAMMRLPFMAVVISIGYAVSEFGRLVVAVGSFGEALNMVRAVSGEAWARMTAQVSAWALSLKADAQDAIAGLLLSLSDAASQVTEFFGALGRAVGGGLAERIEATGLSMARMAVETGRAAMGLRGAATAPLASLEALRAAMAAAAKETDGASEAAARFATALATVPGNGAGGSAAPAAVTAASDALTTFDQSLAEATEGAAEFEGAWRQAFVGFLTGTTTAQDAAKQLLSSLASIAANRVFNQIFGAVAGAALGGGGFSDARGFNPRMMFANGSPFAPGGLSLVGERGPELVNLPRGSQVIDARRSSEMMGGAGGEVRLIIEEAPEFAARVRTEATGVYVRREPSTVRAAVGATYAAMREVRAP